MSPFKPVTVRAPRGLVAMSLAAALALPGAAYVAGSKVSANCEGLHKIVEVGGEIIAAGRGSTEQYYRDGLLTLAQRDRALAQINDQLRRWNSADCK